MRRPTLAQTGAGIVAAVAGYASYRHIVHVASRAGESPSVAALLPLAVDGLILTATAAMAEDKRDRRRPRWSARVALAAGIGATLAANIASAHPGMVSRAVAAWPALAFLIAVEVLAHRGRPLPAEPDDDRDQGDDLDAEYAELVAQLGPPTGRRGEQTERVRHVVTARPELAADPARVARLVGGSDRHVTRILTQLTRQEQPA